MSEDTRHKLLAQAEALFSEAGSEGVSLRQVARAAGVNPALVHYHFGSRDALVEAVVLQRLGPIQQRRRELLDALIGRATQPSVRALLTVLVQPVAEVAAQPGGRAYLKLLSRVFVERQGFTTLLVMNHFGETLRELAALMAAALPEIPREVVGQRITLAVQVSLSTFAHEAPFASDAASIPASTRDAAADTAAVSATLLDFLAGALAAPVSPTPERATVAA